MAAAGLAVVATVVAVVASKTPDDVLSRAREAAQRAGSYRFTLEQGISGARATGAVSTFKMTGAVDVGSGRTTFEVVSGDRGASMRCRYVTARGTYYTRVHPTRRAAFGADWVRSPTAAALAGSAFQFRPDQLYATTQTPFDDLERTGTAQVRGVATTTYSGELDLAALTATEEATPLPASAAVRVPVVVSVDADARLRRITFDLRPSGSSADTLAFSSEMEMFDYGEPVDITVPSDAKDGSPEEAATACVPAAQPPPA